MKYTVITEGTTRLRVPSISLERAEPPTTPVFFNPAASINRDLSVAVTSATQGRTYCDSLSGIGARGIRLAREVRRRMEVTLVDFNGSSLSLARINAKLNSVSGRCEFVRRDANAFLHSRFRRDLRFDFVDVDPFGTPIEFLQGALNACADGGLVSVTATDTAVLCGVHHQVARRRYGAGALSNCFKHETGLRIIVNACRKLAASLDIGISPVLVHSTRHYMRAYVRVEVGATKADRSCKWEGYVGVCRKCQDATTSSERQSVCGRCGGKVASAGPLWTGDLVDEKVVGAALAQCRARGFEDAAEICESVKRVNLFPPYGYSLQEILLFAQDTERLGPESRRNPRVVGARVWPPTIREAGPEEQRELRRSRGRREGGTEEPAPTLTIIGNG